jgi:uncharacterized protein
MYVNERDRFDGKPLYQAVIDRCRELNVAVATAFRALEGFGETAELHRAHLFQGDQPIVITIIETSEKVRELLPVLEGMMKSGVIAVTDVEVIVVGNRTV